MKSKRLKVLMMEYEMTSKELAHKLNLSVHTIFAYREGKRDMSENIINKIAKVFNVSEKFITGEEHLLRR